MKRKLVPLILFALLIAATPMLALIPGQGAALPPAQDPLTVSADPSGTNTADEPPAVYEGGTIIVFDEATGQPLTLTEREYVLGALMCEMPALYEPEALKAQAVACHTYALNIQRLRAANPDPALMGAAFSVNSEALSGYMTKERAMSVYGSQFEAYYAKMQAAVDAVLPYTLTYNSEPIAACYHAISPGKTEYSENVFSSAVPYLVAVDSAWDTAASGYESEAVFTASEFEDALRIYDSAFETSGSPADWLGGARLSESGTVLTQTICGREYTGPQLREALGLRSAAFDAAYNDNQFTFNVRGYGHGVGLSQNGANGMAKEGKTFEEILAHYYPGTTLTRANV